MKSAAIISSLTSLGSETLKRVSPFLTRIVRGSDEVFVNPLLKDNDANDILSRFDSVFKNGSGKMNSVLIDIEMNQRSKFGPRSIATSWEERKVSLYESFGLGDDVAPPPIALGPSKRLRPLSIRSAITFLKNSTNSGLPALIKKVRVKSELVGETLESLYNTVFEPCMLFTRTQENKKTRAVWGFAILLTLYEMCFYRPVLDIQSKQPWRSALRTPDEVDLGITKIILSAQRLNLDILSIDFTAYDNSVKRALQQSAFSSIKQLFQSQYHRHIDKLAEIFNTIGIVTPDGVLSGPHGVPSGSTFTNEVDSIVQFSIASICDDIYNVNLSQVQGDDGVYLVTNAEKVVKHFESYGLKPSALYEKSFIAKDWCVYLQSLYHVDYIDKNGIIGGIYPIYRALNRILYLERFEDFSDYDIKGSDYFAIRTISIMENCKHHPLFEEFVAFVAALDKYKLEFSDQGLDSFVRRLSDKEGKDVTFREWTYGSDVKGLKTFETFKVLQKLYVE